MDSNSKTTPTTIDNLTIQITNLMENEKHQFKNQIQKSLCNENIFHRDRRLVSINDQYAFLKRSIHFIFPVRSKYYTANLNIKQSKSISKSLQNKQMISQKQAIMQNHPIQKRIIDLKLPLKNIYELNLSGIFIGQFTFQMKTNIQSCRNLVVLILTKCKIYLLNNLPRLCYLEQIDLTCNRIPDAQIEKLYVYSSLRVLCIGGNKIKKISTVKGLQKKFMMLEALQCSRNQIKNYQNSFSKIFGFFPNLKSLDNLDKNGKIINPYIFDGVKTIDYQQKGESTEERKYEQRIDIKKLRQQQKITKIYQNLRDKKKIQEQKRETFGNQNYPSQMINEGTPMNQQMDQQIEEIEFSLGSDYYLNDDK